MDEWGFVSEDRDQAVDAEMGHASLAIAVRRFRAWLGALSDLTSSTTHVINRVAPCTAEYVTEYVLGGPNAGEPSDGHLLIVNAASAWEALGPMQREFRRHFGAFYSATLLGEREQNERINFRHLWAVGFAMRDERSRHLFNAGDVVLDRIAAERQLFLAALVAEVSGALGASCSVEVRQEPWMLDETPHLCLICDHESAGTMAAASAKVVEGIWRAAHRFAWQPGEWRPLVVEWPKIAVVHLLRGRALQAACARLSTEVIFATDSSFEVKPHHLLGMPVDNERFREAGFLLWDSPLLRATWALHNDMTAFILFNTQFYSLVRLTIERALGGEARDWVLARFSQELTALWNAARRSYARVAVLLDTISGPDVETWKAEVERLCAIRLLSVDPDVDVTIDLDSFVSWMEGVESTQGEYENLLLSFVSASVESRI